MAQRCRCGTGEPGGIRPPDGIALWLSVEGQTVALMTRRRGRRRCGCIRGETTAFSVALSQGRCLWRLQAPGYFVFETTDIRCDDAENETPAGHDAAGSDGGLDDLRHRLPALINSTGGRA
ncbi:hypothetical protein J4732_11645 [Serratia marcescens]|uniref:Uncharacterized protein n=1 Tax=Serratia marcescens TaxID=615 RepID=A0A939NQF9_SERMA|nr:hypothetical protein [Serratia marcescens]